MTRKSLALQTGTSGEKLVFFLPSVFRQYSVLRFTLAVVADSSWCGLNDDSQAVFSLSLSFAWCVSGNQFKGGCVFHGVTVTVLDVILA